MKKLTLSFLLCTLWLSFFTTTKAQTYCPPNINFENGGFTNWICNVGAVTSGTTGNAATLTYPINPTGPSITQHVLKTSGLDTFGQFPTVCNYINGNHFSVRLGDEQIGAICARMNYKINVPTNNNNFSLTFYYALVFQQPRHPFEAQPGFSVTIIDSATNLPVNLCSNFYIVQPVSGMLNGFLVSPISPSWDSIYYKGWTASTLDFSGLAGKTIYLQFDAFDCAYAGHFGYAYVDLPNNCNGNSFTQGSTCSSANLPQLIAPGGYSAYQWYDSSFTNLLSTSDTFFIPTSPIDTSLHYCVLTPLNNWGCMDTVAIKYNPNPVAVANFNYPTSYCVNSATHFIDNSFTTITGAYINEWAWNFGDINATSNNPNTDSTENPTHIYSAMGNYTVCLIAHSNINCLADTICQTININRVAPISIIKFTKDSICGLGDTTTIYPISSAIVGYTYQWIIDPNAIVVSGNLNAHQPIVLKYKTTGNHTIQFVATPPPTDTNCTTTAITQVYVKAIIPFISIMGVDSICPNNTTTLSVNNTANNCGAAIVPCNSSTNISTIGTNSSTTAGLPTPFYGFYTEQKMQMIYTAAELNAAGFYGGQISEIAFDITSKGSTAPFQNFNIKLACISYSDFNLPATFDTSISKTIVYSNNAYSTIVGVNSFPFNIANYSWDGTSNLLVEVCFDNGTTNYTQADNVKKSNLGVGNIKCVYAFSDNDPLDGCDVLYDGNVIYPATFTFNANDRPDITFKSCNLNVFPTNTTFNWSSNPSGFSSTNQNIVVSPSANTTYTVTANDNGCMFSKNHVVKIASLFNVQINQSLCMGSVYTFNGKTYTATGVYYDTIHTSVGCDTMLILNLLFTNFSKYITVTDCAPYFFYGNWISTTGYYFDTIPSTTNGCDTIASLSYIYLPTTSTHNGLICNGTPYYYSNKVYNSPGIYIDTIHTGSCTTIDTLILTPYFAPTTVIKNGNTLYAVNTSPNIFYYEWIDCNTPSNILTQFNQNFFTPFNSGSYAVIISDGMCSDTSACFVFNTNCIANYSVNYDTLNNTFIVTLDTITAQQATSYLWNFGDGSTSTSATPTHVYTVDTTYNVCLQIVTAIGDTCNYCHIIGKDYQGHIIKNAGFTINIKNPLLNGIGNSLMDDNHFSIYPNPCGEKLLVTGYQLLDNTIQIMDVLGRTQMVRQANHDGSSIVGHAEEGSISIDVSALPSGIYFIKATDVNGNVMNGKFVKE
ncbi:MAG: hypothetical protein RL708_1662 [Bacteroidota bacterium]|jgi:hypothetical protein